MWKKKLSEFGQVLEQKQNQDGMEKQKQLMSFQRGIHFSVPALNNPGNSTFSVEELVEDFNTQSRKEKKQLEKVISQSVKQNANNIFDINVTQKDDDYIIIEELSPKSQFDLKIQNDQQKPQKKTAKKDSKKIMIINDQNKQKNGPNYNLQQNINHSQSEVLSQQQEEKNNQQQVPMPIKKKKIDRQVQTDIKFIMETSCQTDQIVYESKKQRENPIDKFFDFSDLRKKAYIKLLNESIGVPVEEEEIQQFIANEIRKNKEGSHSLLLYLALNNNFKLKSIKRSFKTSHDIFFEIEFENGYTSTVSQYFLETFFKEELFDYFKKQLQYEI